MPRKWLIYSAALVLLLTACINEVPTGANIQVGDTVPHFFVTMSDGSVVSDMTLAGSVAVVVFFNTGCKDCQQELPVLEQFYRQSAADCRLVCISRAEREESVAAYWQAEGLTMPYSAQPDRQVYELFASVGIPRIYVINKEGIVAAAWDDSAMPSVDDLMDEI